MEYVAGVKSFGGGRIVLEAPPAAVRELVERQAKTVRLIVPDPDKITPRSATRYSHWCPYCRTMRAECRRGDKRRQREVLCALQLSYLIDTSDHEAVRERLTYHYCQLCGVDLFSLSERSPDAGEQEHCRGFHRLAGRTLHHMRRTLHGYAAQPL